MSKKSVGDALVMDDHFNALFEGVELTDGAKDKIKTLFESAVEFESTKKVDLIKKELDEARIVEMEEVRTKVEAEVDGYLQLVVEEWTQKNKPAIVSQHKLNLAEDFMQHIMRFLDEHNLELPEKTEVAIKDLEESVSNFERDNAALAVKNSLLSKELNEARCKILLAEKTSALSDMGKAKIAPLVESVSTINVADFCEKVDTIITAYKSALNEGSKPDDEEDDKGDMEGKKEGDKKEGDKKEGDADKKPAPKKSVDESDSYMSNLMAAMTAMTGKK